MNRTAYSRSLGLMLVSIMVAGVFLFPTGARSQAPGWTVYDPGNSGLPSKDVRALVMDDQGNTWIGTYHGGLAKFDGVNWMVYNTSNSGLPNNDVWALVMDATRENVWIGTFDGLAKFDGKNWEVYNTDNSVLPNNNIRALARDKQGNTWIGTNRGLVKFGEVDTMVYNTSNSKLPNNEIRALATDEQGNIWIGTVIDRPRPKISSGLAKFDGVNWEVYGTRNSVLPSNHVRALAIDDQENVWIGMSNGLAKFDGVNWTVYDTRDCALPNNSVYALAMDAQGDIIIGTGTQGIGTGGGLAKFDGVNWKVYDIDNSDLPNNDVRALAMDAQGDVWIGTRGGLALLALEEIDPLEISNVRVSDVSRTSATITWDTDKPASGFLHYGTAPGEYLVRVPDPLPPKTQHRVTLTDLTPGTTYYYVIVQDDEANNRTKSEEATFTTKSGVTFVQETYRFDIERTYDQRVEVSIQNDDVVPHRVYVSLSHPYEDLILGFIRPGSADQPLTLGPDEGRNIILVIHAQDARVSSYEITLEMLEVRADGGEEPVDSATAMIYPRMPVFDLVVDEVGEDPRILAKTFRITNRGDELTDLTVWLEPGLAGKMNLRPGIQHALLATDDTLAFEVIPIISADFDTTLRCRGYVGNDQDSTAFDFVLVLPPESKFFPVCQDIKIWERVMSLYCTNNPWVEIPFQIPPYSMPEILEKVYLEVSFSLPWPQNAYREHDVHILVNDNEVDTLLNIIPEGRYIFQVDPSYVNHDFAAVNVVQFDTRGLPGSDYVLCTDIGLLFHISDYCMYVVAESQEEADAFLPTYEGTVEGCDLAISTDMIQFSEEHPKAGTDVIISADVDNLGMEDAEDVLVRFYDGPPENGVQIGTHLLLSVPSQRRVPVPKMMWTIPPGMHTVYVVADPEGAIEEIREDNNIAFQTISTDETEPPEVLSTFPGTDFTEVYPNTEIRIRFSEPMDRGSAEAAFSIEPEVSGVSGSFSWPDSSQMVFSPNVELLTLTTYTVTIDTSAKDPAGNSTIFPYRFSFTTGEWPDVVSTVPGDGATDVALDTDIRITFNEPMQKFTVQAAFSMVDEVRHRVVRGDFTWPPEDFLMVFTPEVELDKRTRYTVTIDKSAQDLAGYQMTADKQFRFTTVVPDEPWIVSTSPEDGATNVPLDTDIRITFSEPMKHSSVDSAFSITPKVVGSVEWAFEQADFSQMVFTPYMGLAERTTYRVKIARSARDLVGDEMISDSLFYFTARGGGAPFVVSTIPKHGAEVDPDTDIRVTFSEPMQAWTAQAAFSIEPYVSGSFSPWPEDSVMVFTPDKRLECNSSYFITIAGSAQDLDGNEMGSDYAFDFFISISCEEFEVVSTIPEHGARDVDPGANIRVTFNKPADHASAEAAFSIEPEVSGDFSWPEPSVMVFTPDERLEEYEFYPVTIAGSAQDLYGNGMISDYQFAFRTDDGGGPEVVWTIPKHGAKDVDPGTDIRVKFSEPVDRGSAEAAFSIEPEVSGVSDDDFSWPDSSQMVFTPDEELAEGTLYAVTIAKSVQDMDGNEMMSDHLFFFWVPPDPLWVSSTIPEHDASDVDPGTNIRITFTEPMQAWTAEAAFSMIDEASQERVSGKFSSPWPADTVMVFTPDEELAEGIYTVTIAKSAQGLDGSGMISEYPFTFSVPSPDGEPLPEVVWTIPEHGATYVDGTAIHIMFSEPMHRGTVEAAFSIKPYVSGSEVYGSFSWPEPGDSLMVFTLDEKLADGTVYIVRIAGARDLDGNEMIPHYFLFQTPPDPPPWVVSTIPEGGATDVDPDTDIRITFSEPMNRGTAENAFSMVDEDLQQRVSGKFSSSDSVMVFTPDEKLVKGTFYTVMIARSAQDLDGNAMISDYPFRFRVSPPPWVVSTIPRHGATDVDPDTDIRITFSDSMDHGSAQAAFSIEPEVSGVSDDDFSWPAASVMVFTPDSLLSEGITYTVTIARSAKDLDGYEVSSDYQFVFSVPPGRPWVVSTIPKHRNWKADPDTDIRITFSESMDQGSAKAAFSIEPEVSGVSDDDFSWPEDSVMVFTPDSLLSEGLTYTVKIARSAKDLDGWEMRSDRSFDFGIIDDDIREPSDIEIRGSSAFITWKTDEPTKGTVQYGTQSGDYPRQAADSGYRMTHRVELKNLALGTYYYIILSVDRSGNQCRTPEKGQYTLHVTSIPNRPQVPLERIEISPASVELRAGESITFRAQGYDVEGNPVDVQPFWHITGNIGTIDPVTGVFVAGDTPGSGDVVAFVQGAFAEGVFGDTSTNVVSGTAKVVVKAVPEVYALSPNYPNPFNLRTTLRYALPEASVVWLVIYNLSGQRVRVLDEQMREAGWYVKMWDGRDEEGREMASGVYLVHLVAWTHPKRPAFSATRRMVLIR